MPPAPLVSRSERNAYWMVFVLFFLTYGYFFQGGGWNQNSKICLVRSIVHDRTVAIDSCREDAADMEFANAGDWSSYGGHYYSNKSPGHAFLAVPSYMLADFLLGRLFPDDQELQVKLSAYFSTICTTGFFSALLGLLIFHFFLRFCSLSMVHALLLSLFSGFGTLAFSYSTTFYSHQLSAFFAFFSFIILLHLQRGDLAGKRRALLLSGLSISLGVLGEPSCIFILGALTLYLLTSRRTRAYLPYFLLGGVPAGAVQIYYNWVCFGHPLSYSYQFANPAVMVAREGRLFGIPTPDIIYNLLVSPYRGLFFSSPVLIMSLPGFFTALREKTFTREAVFSAGISATFFLLLASYYGWDGGATVGPRDIIAIYPFLFLLAGFAYPSFPRFFRAIGVLSVVLNLSITLVGNEIPSSISNPLGEVVFKNLRHGTVSINPFPLSHLERYASEYPSIYDFADVEKWKPNGNSFNLGELVFPNRLISAVPLLCFWSGWFLIWRKLSGGGTPLQDNRSGSWP